jgi:hypothetical protein
VDLDDLSQMVGQFEIGTSKIGKVTLKVGRNFENCFGTSAIRNFDRFGIMCVRGLEE